MNRLDPPDYFQLNEWQYHSSRDRLPPFRVIGFSYVHQELLCVRTDRYPFVWFWYVMVLRAIRMDGSCLQHFLWLLNHWGLAHTPEGARFSWRDLGVVRYFSKEAEPINSHYWQRDDDGTVAHVAAGKNLTPESEAAIAAILEAAKQKLKTTGEPQ